VVLAASAAAVLLAACGEGGPGEASVLDAADTEYATSVVSHHAQTLALLDLTLGRDDLDPQIGVFADQARSGLFAEVNAATRRLAAWGAKVPRTALEHSHDDTVTYDTSVAGVLSSDQLNTLAQTDGRAFENAWLRALITHERGALKLAVAGAQNGENVAAVAAAQKDQQVHEDHIEALTRLAAR
jgi:uncharacterized protein (DUF305 family)